jgi:hypothetical protein
VANPDPQQLWRDLLEHTHGFLVDNDDGEVGVVEDVELAGGQPTALVVACGWLGRRRIRVPAAAVHAIDADARTILIDTATARHDADAARGLLQEPHRFHRLTNAVRHAARRR